MANVEWIKITTDMFDNRKIKYLRKLPAGNDIVLIWVMLLTMAGRCNSGGMIYLTENIPYTTKMLADELGFEENVAKIAIAALEELNMVVTDSGSLCIPGWEEYQNTDGLDKIREQTRKRVQKYREKQKQLEGIVSGNDSVTDCNAIDKEKEEDKENNILCAPEPHEDTKKDKDEQLQNDFETIYALYPKKRGKTVAFANYKQWVSEKGKDVGGRRYRLSNRQIYFAVKKYIRQQEDSGQDDFQYWKNFDTLMGRQLLDYVDLEDGKT